MYAQYGAITPADLQENEDGNKKSYDANMPIEVLFDKIEDGAEFAENASDPYNATQILRIAYNVVYKTGQFNLECDKWTEKDPGEKTWANFKVYFTLSHKRMRESKATADNAGLGSANAILEETATQLANLALNTQTTEMLLRG